MLCEVIDFLDKKQFFIRWGGLIFIVNVKVNVKMNKSFLSSLSLFKLLFRVESADLMLPAGGL